MQKQIMTCINQGMNRDIGISQLSEKAANYAFENHNIRITAVNDNTLYTVTNEKGTKFELTINGTFLGSCILNDYIVIFTKDTDNNTDYIYRLEYNAAGDEYKSYALYQGKLNFDIAHPIEAIGYYESQEVQKVYWVDGTNPNRFINIANDKNGIYPDYSSGSIYQFDFQGHINSIPNISITKNYNKAGTFQAGTIQYFATYYNKYGTETCIVWQSDLQYISMSDRGAKPDEVVSCTFDFTIENLDTAYDYIRIYAAYRAGLNGTAEGRIVAELEISNDQSSLSYSDYGTNYINYNAEDIHYLGGQNIIASTLDYKQDTLFLGDIKLASTQLPKGSDLHKSLYNCQPETIENKFEIDSCKDISFELKSLPSADLEGVYYYKNQLSESQEDIAGFKHREIYRFAVQLLTDKGEWTSPIYIGDKYCDKYPIYDDANSTYCIPQVQYVMNDAAKSKLLQWNENNPDNKFIQVRLLMAQMDSSSRRILAQGVVNPTMFNYRDRINNKPYSINSWLFRPRQSQLANRHYEPIPAQDSPYAEIQGITSVKIPGFDPQASVDANEANSYLLFLYLSGDWITDHTIGYVLYKYNSDGYVDTRMFDINGEQKEGFSPYQGDHNKILWSRYAIKPGSETANKDEAREWLVRELGEHLGMSDAMIPTGEELKRMARATESTDNPDLIWGIVGAAIVTVVATAVTIVSFGSAAPLTGTATALMWTALATTAATAATAGAAATATLAEQLKNAPKIDREVGRLGFIPLLEEYKHSGNNKNPDYAEAIYNQTCLDFFYNNNTSNRETSIYGKNDIINVRGQASNTDKDGNTINGEDKLFYYYVTGYINAGRLTFQSPLEEDANNKREQYYVDESVVTLNSPDLDNLNININNLKDVTLDIVGTIPISSNQADVLMYADTQGIASQAGTVDTIVSNKYSSNNIEGIVSGGLYQDVGIEISHDSEEAKWSDIQPKVGLDLYKVFMWNRDTSWSCYIPGINIVDPVSLRDTEQPTYLQYIPGMPKKKIIANMKVSHNTTYHDYYTDSDNKQEYFSMQIESPKLFNTEGSSLIQFNSNNNTRNYYANVDTFSINTNGYTLLNSRNNSIWKQPDTGTNQLFVYDPISIKYKTTTHAVLPINWDNGNYVILPYLNQESQMQMADYYTGLTGNLNIEGFQKESEQEKETWDTGTITGEHAFNPGEVSEKTGSYSHLPSKTIILEQEVLYVFKVTDLWYYFNPAPGWYGGEGDEITEDVYDPLPEMLFYISFGNTTPLYLREGEELKIKLQPGTYEVRYGPILKAHFQPYPSDEGLPYYYKVNFTCHGICDVSYSTQNIYTVSNQKQLNWNEENPYLFMGELVKDFHYDNWLGGISDFALQQLNWNICSNSYSIEDTIDKTWGDTYYQRWDCLKTYPTTEQDKNSIVEVLSFMVESYTNLDGRSDVNRGVNNLLNLRPSNTNLFNPVYNQQDNFFSYKVLDEKFDKNVFENQVVWSLSKTNLDNIDKWADINAVNSLQLDGRLGSINKIINMNDTLLAFQDTGISTIDYNLKSALTTHEGVPLQMGNTGKVTGYTKVTSDIGCHNKWAMCLTDSGLFFIDSYRKALYAIASNASPTDISSTKYFSIWFKENINNDIWNPNTNTQAFRLNYDSSTQDLYIINDSTCLLYNVGLQSFTSFMDYINTPIITNIQGKSIALSQITNELKLYTMFEGPYDEIYGNNMNYSIEYRLNPSPYTDNLFTNYQYVADWTDSNTKSNDYKQFDTNRFDHFDTVEAWNEYQHGILKADTGTGIRPIKTKFRIWRGDIPKDGDTLEGRKLKGDRMRNPWIHLKFSKNNINNTKMTFHNLNVIYYN